VKLEKESIGRQTAGGQFQPDLFSQEPAMPRESPESPKTPNGPLEHPALALLRAIAPDELSPRQALEELYVLKKASEKQ
jgi:DNA mismatch repair protein MutS